ncbi:MAG: hypothetical protein EP347_10405 [Alphaproteobacteria bacterium]|nr:MAG: hypothetical protein EP347_10405 [Alphaproteobacteria bacterium]
MKRLFLTLVVGLVGGFAIGAYTPVADYLSLEGLQVALQKVEKGEVAEEETQEGQTPFAKLKSAVDVVKTVGSESRGALDAVELAMAKTKPSNWVMAYEDVSQSEDPIAQAAMQAEGGERQLTQDQQDAIAFLEVAKEGMLQENEAYKAKIEKVDENHPESFFLKILLESNESMIVYVQHLIDLQSTPLTIESLAALQGSLDNSETKINQLVAGGIDATNAWTAVNSILPARSDDERAMKVMIANLFATYGQSFANEQALASKMTDYPSLVAMEIASGGDGSMVEAWAGELAVLADMRMAIQAKRQQLATEIIMSSPTS